MKFNQGLSLIITIIFFIILFSTAHSSQSEILNNSENYRIEVINANSSTNAIKISEKLHTITQKPVYVEQTKDKWKVLVGGLKTLEEAQKVKNQLDEIGIKNLKIIKVINASNNNTVDSSPPSDLSSLPEGKVDLYVTEINSDIKIDGYLNEPEWDKASTYLGRFYQQMPYDRIPSTELTEVKILADKKYLYFGIRCLCTEPDKIFATEMREDAFLHRDDQIELLLDTFNDGRNCYYFSTNPLGAMIDAMVTDEGNFINRDWDGVWSCKTSRDENGWTVEMEIPFKTLKFNEGENSYWGINIGRENSHEREIAFICPIPRSLNQRGKYKASLFARLNNIPDLKTGKDIRLIPYTSGGKIFEYRPNSNSSRFNRGLDVRYNLTPNLTLDLTYETDFSQVESDQEIVNLTRFNVNLPEKKRIFS